MKVELRDLKQKKWFIEIDPAATINDLKTLNATERELDENANQRLIYSGKILKDADTLETIKYVEGKSYIVCIVSKKPAPKKAPQPTTANSVQEPASEVTKTPDVPPVASYTPSTEVHPETPSSTPINGASTFAVGQQLALVVNNITEMGYTRAQAIMALRRAYNNPDRAVEYLVTGQIPEDVREEEEGEGDDGDAIDQEHMNNESGLDDGSEANSNIPSTIDMNLIDGPGSEDTDREIDESEFQGYNFKELLGISDDEMAQLRLAAIRSPDSLIEILHPLLVNNPQLANLILNNMDEFLADIATSGEPDSDNLSANGDPPAPTTIQITAEEDAAITRLMELGFARHIVATAYLACDKDEMLTANYLLENGDDL